MKRRHIGSSSTNQMISFITYLSLVPQWYLGTINIIPSTPQWGRYYPPSDALFHNTHPLFDSPGWFGTRHLLIAYSGIYYLFTAWGWPWFVEQQELY